MRCMKKSLLILIMSLFFINAQANSFLCNYKDYFHLSDKSHPGIYIVNGSDDMDVMLQIVGPRSFLIKDTFRCVSGFAHVTVAYDSYHFCVLDIQDGPYMMHPRVHASCNGIEYKGIKYDGFGSYSYTINLN